MGYVGNKADSNYSSIDKQIITGNGGTGYTLSHSVANANEIEVFVNNVRQDPGVAYTVNNAALTMTGAVANTDSFYVVFIGKAVQTKVPVDGSVTTAKLASGVAVPVSGGTFSGNVTMGGTLGVTGVTTLTGNVGIGNATPSSYDAGARQLVIGDYSSDANTGMTISGSANNHIYFADGTSGDAAYRGSIAYNHAGDHMLFRTAGFNERMRIESNGGVRINNTANATFAAQLNTQFTNAQNCGLYLKVTNTNGAQSMIIFGNTTNNAVGSISTSGSSTAYTTSSDYRLKENVVYDWDATTRLKQLKPARFNFIADADRTVDGFLAHEAQAIVPEAITGTKDAVDVDGNPDYQGIDQSKLVPLLVKTIQELEARLTAGGL
jgi:hypothetical protein